MSRLGKKIISIPKGTEISIAGETIQVKGPLGSLSKTFKNDMVSIEVTKEGVLIKPKVESLLSLKLWGTYASHIQNMLAGVNSLYHKSLMIEGVGFKAEVAGATLVLGLGFSHPVKVPIPPSLKVTVDKNVISVSGVNNEEVGGFSAKVRALKKPEPYKGKGIRYGNEVILRKEGKKSATV